MKSPEFNEVLETFNLSIDEYNDRLFNAGMSVVDSGYSALIFDGDMGVMKIDYIDDSVTYSLVDCNYFDDFDRIVPAVIERLKNAYYEDE